MKSLILAIALTLSAAAAAQNSLPAPGSGSMPGSSLPAPGFGQNNGWGNPWGGGNGPVSPGAPIPPPPPPHIIYNPGWQNSGTTTVIGCGYDASGVWRTIPMVASYSYNGVQYQVTILSAWDPWTDSWDRGIDVPAVTSPFMMRGAWYNFYVVLSTGTFYFNL